MRVLKKRGEVNWRRLLFALNLYTRIAHVVFTLLHTATPFDCIGQVSNVVVFPPRNPYTHFEIVFEGLTLFC
jgi:hypothetical protein